MSKVICPIDIPKSKSIGSNYKKDFDVFWYAY